MVSRSKSRASSHGFTVVELLLSIAVFAIVVPIIILGVVTLSQINQNAINLSYANIIVENKVETLRSMGYNSLQNGTVSFTSDLPVSFGSTKSASYIIATESTGVKSITVSLSYKALNRTVSLNYRTLISELGVGQ